MYTEPLVALAEVVEESEATTVRGEAMVALPADEVTRPKDVVQVVELILKDRKRLDRLIRKPEYQAWLLPRFLGISLVGFLFFGIAIAMVFSMSREWPSPTAIKIALADHSQAIIHFDTIDDPHPALKPWVSGRAFSLTAAYAIGLIAATGVCLPSLYFYGLLAGVKMTMSDVVIHSLKSKATAAIALIGVFPIYATVAFGVAIFELLQPLRMPVYLIGLSLPFLAGLFGTYSMYHGFIGLADTMSVPDRAERTCFLNRLVFSWTVCYTAVTPVMIHTIWTALA